MQGLELSSHAARHGWNPSEGCWTQGCGTHPPEGPSAEPWTRFHRGSRGSDLNTLHQDIMAAPAGPRAVDTYAVDVEKACRAAASLPRHCTYFHRDQEKRAFLTGDGALVCVAVNGPGGDGLVLTAFQLVKETGTRRANARLRDLRSAMQLSKGLAVKAKDYFGKAGGFRDIETEKTWSGTGEGAWDS